MPHGPQRFIVVFGGTGFLGRQVIDKLLQHGHRAVAATRHKPKHGEWRHADITNPASVKEAVAGADAVVNCVSLYVESGGLTFDDIHVAGARTVAEAAKDAGVTTLIHLSGIGADAASSSPYVSARGRGEEAVRAAFEKAMILRPSVMVGPGDAFLSALAGLPRWLPAVPLFGDGSVRLQPVSLHNVARAIRNAVEAHSGDGGVFELGGASVLSYRQCVETVQNLQGRRRPLVPVPMAGWALIARAAGLLGPAAPITEGVVALMAGDNVADPALPGLPALGIKDPEGFEEVAGRYLGE
ncbi:complex I NDUFA9 subunit family protein [Rhodobium gokarnense]|uniref:NADH dehydrogenase n=1 Tax=Rhodobium gokarnense TaxID=364296 RepID=A0ABT3H6E5_9HYPH|nr:complex I NDUFA9 subunit family protein [Rhodobium gokarnense]MCW2305896.1 NADH dehydrogenase [Rhodobium gokarnense]